MKRKGTPRKNGGRGSRLAGHGWRIGVTCIAVLAAFCTVYALVLPATALEGETYCGYTEHVHSDACYETVLVCGQEESAEHTHSDACYEQVLVCGLPEHVHSDACYVNPDAETVTASETVEETAGTEAASDGGEAAQSETTAPETVTEGESALTEGLTEGESSGTEELTETETETAQESETEPETEETETETETEPEEEEPVTLVYDSPEYIVTVTYGAEAQLPENTVLTVKEYDKDSETYKARYAETAALYGWPEETDSSLLEGLPENMEVSDLVRLFDIALTADGVEVEPAVPVSVSIVYRDEEIQAGEPDDIKVLQFPEYGPEKLEAAVTAETGEETIRFNGDQFTDFMLFDGRMDGVTVKEAETESEESAVLPEGAAVPEGYTQQYTARDEGNGFVVTVYAPEGALPEGAVLSAALLGSGNEAYAEAMAALPTGEDEEGGYGFATLDIHFELDGQEIEPESQVYVVIDAQGLLPEDADPESVTVQHHDESAGAVTVETVADAADETAGVVATNNTDVQAAFTVDGFSTFTITWTRGYSSQSVTVYYVDQNGNEIQGSQTTNVTFGANEWVDLDNYAEEIEGYTYQGAHLDSYNGTEARWVTYQSSGQNRWRYSADDSEPTGNGSQWRTYYGNPRIYLVYSEPVKVYVYVAATGLSSECLELLGIDSDTLDQNGYFPAGEIYLDPSYFEGKSNYDVTTAGRPLITSEEDWNELLTALGNMNTSNLADKTDRSVWGYNYDRKDYTSNRDNHVGEYLSQARGDIGYSWGSQHTALFRWHDNPYTEANVHCGFVDQDVDYHLDLFFTTNTINFVYGDNGIRGGNGADGTTADTRTYITGSPIQEPDSITIPGGWYFEGYYSNYECTIPWDGFGDPLTEDTTVYIKLSQEQMMTLSIQKEIAFAEGSASINVSDKQYSFIISTTDNAVAGESYTTSTSTGISFPDTPDGSGRYTATVILTASTKNGADGTVLIYGLPANRGSSQIRYTVTEDTNNVDIDGYTFSGVTYSGGSGEGNNTVTGSGESSTASSTVLATNTYEKVQAVDITITKVDADTKVELSGAKFYLARTVDGNTLYYKYDDVNGVTWSTSREEAYTFISSSDDDDLGEFIIHSLEDGSYTLVETKAPDGYVLPSSSFVFSVTNGKANYGGSESGGTTITITNSMGARLPETGGAGTNLVTTGGLLLMAAAVVSGYGLRRRRGKEAR